MRSKEIVAVLSVSVLAGCAGIDPVSQSPDPAFGEAVKYNTALQTENPNPVYPEDAAQPGDNGDKMQAAVERYRTDKVNDRHHKEVAQSRSSSLSTTEAPASGSSGPK